MVCESDTCTVEFIPKTTNQRFCSERCRSLQAIKRFRKNNKSICQQCGAAVQYRTKLCRSCSGKKDQNDWNNITVGEIVDKRKYQIHSQIRELARKVYKNNNKPYSCFNCGYDKHVEICHIKAIALFDLDEKISVINHIDNLIALCPNCHWEFDNGILILPL